MACQRSQKPAFAVHCEIAGGPHRRQANVASEDRVFGRETVDCFGDLLRMDRFPAWRAGGQFIEAFTRLAIVFSRPIETRMVALRCEAWQKRLQCRPDVAHDAEIDRCTPPDVFGS